MSHEYDTWPADTWVPIPQTENQFNEDIMGPTTEVVEPPAQFQYARGYGQMDYEQPMFQVLPTEEIMSHEYNTWSPGTLVPIPQAENQFNGVKVSTSEVLEPPAQFEYAGGCGQMDCEQPMFQVLQMEGIMSHEYDNWPASTWLPIPQAENQFNEDIMRPTTEVVEPPAQFQYARGYGQMDYEQPMFQVVMAEEIVTYEYSTWPAGSWVPTFHRDNPFCGESVG
jgi:hypothetical protein